MEFPLNKRICYQSFAYIQIGKFNEEKLLEIYKMFKEYVHEYCKDYIDNFYLDYYRVCKRYHFMNIEDFRDTVWNICDVAEKGYTIEQSHMVIVKAINLFVENFELTKLPKNN